MNFGRGNFGNVYWINSRGKFYIDFFDDMIKVKSKD